MLNAAHSCQRLPIKSTRWMFKRKQKKKCKEKESSFGSNRRRRSNWCNGLMQQTNRRWYSVTRPRQIFTILFKVMSTTISNASMSVLIGSLGNRSRCPWSHQGGHKDISRISQTAAQLKPANSDSARGDGPFGVWFTSSQVIVLKGWALVCHIGFLASRPNKAWIPFAVWECYCWLTTQRLQQEITESKLHNMKAGGVRVGLLQCRLCVNEQVQINLCRLHKNQKLFLNPKLHFL